jgi:hypothetical protein
MVKNMRKEQQPSETLRSLKGKWIVSVVRYGEYRYTVKKGGSDIGKALFFRNYCTKEVVYYDENTFKGTKDELIEIHSLLQDYINHPQRVHDRLVFSRV